MSNAVTKDDLRKIAQLANLGPDEATLDALVDQANQVLEFVAVLGDVDTTDVTPMAHTQGHGTPLREDRVIESTQANAILGNAPAIDATFYNVPKVMG
jgi:aspartyl-tRNA(Asn)/glutamyl-tRNA(Gln) amidotransferase subunit C